MYVYIAARYSRKEEMIEVQRELERVGLIVTSRWLTEPHPATTGLEDVSDADNRYYAGVDLEDIERCDHILFFSESNLYPRGGRHVEFGYALGLGKKLHVVGERENIFHYLDSVVVHVTLQHYLDYMTEAFRLGEELA